MIVRYVSLHRWLVALALGWELAPHWRLGGMVVAPMLRHHGVYSVLLRERATDDRQSAAPE